MLHSKQDALLEIIGLAKKFDISSAEIAHALDDTKAQRAGASASILNRLFAYIGSIFLFSGLALFTEMLWPNAGFAGQLILTLGVGFSAFLIAIGLDRKQYWEMAITPLVLMAALWQTAGIATILQEYSTGGDRAYGIAYMSFVMLIQQGFAFMATRITALAFTSIFFGVSLFTVVFDLLDIPLELIGIVMGISLLCIGLSLEKSRNFAIAPLILLGGSIAFLAATFDIVHRTAFEILYLGATIAMIVFSANIRSRTLLIVGSIATFGFISYYTGKHFADALSWPLLLMLLGILFICTGYVAVKINNKFIKQKG